MESVLEVKSLQFAVRAVKLRIYLNRKREYNIADQISRSGTSIGANIVEARQSYSRKEFISKLQISLKECRETLYWLDVLFQSNYLTEKQFTSLKNDCTELFRMLIATLKTSKQSTPSN